MEKYDVSYQSIKSAIIKSCRQLHKNDIEFIVDYDRLSRNVDDIGLTVVNTGFKCKPIRQDDIIPISEFFKKQKLAWITEKKYFTQLVFVRSDAIDEELSTLLSQMHQTQVNDPDLDKVNTLAKIIANYPCYFATVVSYESNDPMREGKPTYTIGCRANTITIENEKYKYQHADMS